MRSDTDRIIAEVFRLTGVRITADDPILAVLLIQEQQLQAALADIGKQQTETNKAFIKEIAAHESNILEAAATLETYREQILADLLRQAGQQLDEAEPRIYAAVNKRVAENVQQTQRQFLNEMKKLMVGFFVVLAVMALALVLFCLQT